MCVPPGDPSVRRRTFGRRRRRCDGGDRRVAHVRQPPPLPATSFLSPHLFGTMYGAEQSQDNRQRCSCRCRHGSADMSRLRTQTNCRSAVKPKSVAAAHRAIPAFNVVDRTNAFSPSAAPVSWPTAQRCVAAALPDPASGCLSAPARTAGGAPWPGPRRGRALSAAATADGRVAPRQAAVHWPARLRCGAGRPRVRTQIPLCRPARAAAPSACRLRARPAASRGERSSRLRAGSRPRAGLASPASTCAR